MSERYKAEQMLVMVLMRASIMTKLRLLFNDV